MEELIPSWANLAGWAGVLLASLAFIGVGRLLSLGRAAPEAALVAGWGGACVLLTLWGVATAASLRLPAAAIVAFGLLGLAAPCLRLEGADWRGVLRMGGVAFPLLLVMASARPSLPDTFLNLLPNAAYLWDHASFPADDRWPSHSFLPGAPYNLQLAALTASLVTPDFPPSAMIGLNLVLQLAFALFLARLVDRGEADPAAAPSWTACAAGLLLATAINPGFVPRYHVSAYSEASVTVTVGFAAWFAARALERLAARRLPRDDLALFALSLAALVNIKQDSVALAAGIVGTALVLALAQGKEGRVNAVAMLALAALPAAIVHVAWRWYVLTHFALGELKPLPFAQWQFASLPLILRSMAEAILEKPYFFGAMALALAGLSWSARKRGLDRTTRVAALLAGVTLVYNAALVFAYVAHFPGGMGTGAHSYFRYNTHLGLLLVLTLVLLGRGIAQDRGWKLSGEARRAMTPLLIGAATLSPVIFLGYLRFDLEAPQQRAWQLAALADRALGDGNRLALVLPGDNESVRTMLEGLIRLTPPRHPDAELRTVEVWAPGTLDRLAAEGYGLALVTCTPAGLTGIPAGEAALLEHTSRRWRAVALEPYPAPRGRHWSQVLAEAPLCL